MVKHALVILCCCVCAIRQSLERERPVKQSLGPLAFVVARNVVMHGHDVRCVRGPCVKLASVNAEV